MGHPVKILPVILDGTFKKPWPKLAPAVQTTISQVNITMPPTPTIYVHSSDIPIPSISAHANSLLGDLPKINTVHTSETMTTCATPNLDILADTMASAVVTDTENTHSLTSQLTFSDAGQVPQFLEFDQIDGFLDLLEAPDVTIPETVESSILTDAIKSADILVDTNVEEGRPETSSNTSGHQGSCIPGEGKSVMHDQSLPVPPPTTASTLLAPVIATVVCHPHNLYCHQLYQLFQLPWHAAYKLILL